MNLRPRKNPANVRFISLASCTARLDGADTEASSGAPATSTFCTISNPPRPLTSTACPASGIRPCIKAHPITLSTALCLANIFAQHQQFPFRVEQRSGMQPARAAENLLCSAQLFRQLAQHLWIESAKQDPAVECHGVEFHRWPVFRKSHMQNRPENRRATLVSFYFCVVRELHSNQIRVRAVLAVRKLRNLQRNNLFAPRDNSFRKQEPGRKVQIVTRRSHGDSERVSAGAIECASPAR